MNEEVIIGKIHSAYRTLLSRDMYLFRVDVNERSLAHKLAEYLQSEFPEWNVDCEYNRNGVEPKRMQAFKNTIGSIAPDDTDGVTVYPDIIVHHRGTNDNLIVIEAKKSSYSGQDHDGEKLKMYKQDFGYDHAFKVIFPVSERELTDFEISKYVQLKQDD